MFVTGFRFAYQMLLCRHLGRLSQVEVRGSLPEKMRTASLYCDALAFLTGGRAAKRGRIKQPVLILHQQLSLFRQFNEACGVLDMQPISQLPPSKPCHPRNTRRVSAPAC